MTSTVTTNTIATASAAPIAGALGLLVILVLIVLLVAKEVAVGTQLPAASSWSVALRTAIVPLVITFALIVAVNIASAVS
jgi:hypothetical protein